jgi:hypothetical protein
MRYYRQIETKVSLLVDLYDTSRYPKNWYNKRNPFDANKTVGADITYKASPAPIL